MFVIAARFLSDIVEESGEHPISQIMEVPGIHSKHL
jgi:hypothetical protein